MAGHYITINNHNIFGYSRYIDFYHQIVHEAKDDDLFVELGSFLGQSTAAMAQYIVDSQKRIRLDAVDLFEISDFSDEPHAEIINQHGGDFLEAFKSNLRNAQVLDKVNIVKGLSLEVAATYEDRSISFLMIDASHKYEDVVDDIKVWLPKMKVGGIISGDDFDWPSVAQAVKDTLPNHRLYNPSTWFYIKQTP
jgi:predicted O-methyltransferase YrrM